MNHLRKGKAKYIFTGLLTSLFVFIFLYVFATYNHHYTNYKFIFTDTIIPRQLNVKESLKNSKSETPSIIDSLTIIKSSNHLTDSIAIKVDTLTFKTSKDTLSAPIEYNANDSIVFDVPKKMIFMYGRKSMVKYLDNSLMAPFIQFNQTNGIVTAQMNKDSVGNIKAYPTFTQADFKSISDSITFNMKNGKGLTIGTYTQQGELFVYGERIKKTDPDIFYAKKGRFTTCNLDTPHFAFVSDKVKFINKKMAFTGPVHPEFEGVPLPVALPFGIYPLKIGIHSGFLSPNFSANDQLGIAMEGLGYYQVFNDNWDIITRGTLYSYGGWTLNVSPRYYKKYRYQGNFSLDMQRFKNGFKTDPDYSTSQTYNVRWSHNADSKARPGVNFNANVNFGSSKFNAQVPNSPTRNFTNQMYSSITYSKIWKDKPYNISISANHNQNTQQRLLNINFPDISFNVNTQYPFRRKEVLGNYKWYENIGVAFNTNDRGLSYFYDTTSNVSKQLTDNLKWGASHSIPITLSLPSLGPVQIAPSVSYQEKWYQEKFIKVWNPDERKVDTIIKNGLYTARDMSFGVGMSTRIFGLFSFKKENKVQAIRHEIRPSVSASYKPNMNARSYYQTQIDTAGNTYKNSYYERSIFGSFSDVRFGGLNFDLDNVIQMKVKKSSDTAESSMKKVSLIDGLNLSGNYNFLLDSFKMSNLSLSARSNLFDKINITGNAQFDPYLRNEQGRRVDKLIWTKKPASLGMLTSGGISLQSRFDGGDNKSKKRTTSNNTMSQRHLANDLSADQNQQELMNIQNNPSQYVDFSVPWNINLSYSLRFSRTVSGIDPNNIITKTNQDINWSGHLTLTPKWNIGLSGSYNVTEKQVGVLSVDLSRDLHCWQMNVVMSPIGKYRYFTINISPKSSLLRDIKVNRTRYFYDL